MSKTAVIDLGTNTFHLFIVEIEKGILRTLYKEKIAVKIGQNGIQKGKIAQDAYKRAVHTLKVFKTVLNQFEVTQVQGVATSAIRNAKNGQALLDEIKACTGIEIDVISGDREAELIYYGVKAAIDLKDTAHLMMDIGGGSVEFIIGNDQEILWKKSFEIGAQRLLDKFHQVDPIPQSAISSMNAWLNSELKELIDAIKTHQPRGFIGCSGTFDTLREIYIESQNGPTKTQSTAFDLPIEAYHLIHGELMRKNRKERLNIPGMVSMRVDMIVVASCLIKHVLEYLNVGKITACSYALKEGVLFINHQNTSISDL